MTTVTFTDEETEACGGYFIAIVTMMLCHTLQGMELVWCFWCSLGSQSGLDNRQEVASPELPSLLWCPPAGPAVGTLVFGAVRYAGCVALASLCPSGLLCPSQPGGIRP